MTLREVALKACDICSQYHEMPEMGPLPALRPGQLAPEQIAIKRLAEAHGFTLDEVESEMQQLCHEDETY